MICICRTPPSKKSVTLVDRSAIYSDPSARAFEEQLGRKNEGAVTTSFSANRQHVTLEEINSIQELLTRSTLMKRERT